MAYQYSFTQIRWAMRRLMLSLPKSAIAIEIGSGGNPTPRSDILVEPYLDGEHESSKGVIVDRPTFAMKAESLPFRDGAFDYSICFHVLEHTDDPSAFIDTLTRISNAGYIETPTPFNELLFPYDFHMSAVALSSECGLKVYGLDDYDSDTLKIVRESIKQYIGTPEFLKFYRRNPNLFNTVLRWEGSIETKLIGRIGTAYDFSDYKVPAHPHHENKKNLKQLISPIMRDFLRAIFKKKVDITSLLKCSKCGSVDIEATDRGSNERHYKCSCCGTVFLKEINQVFWPVEA